MQKNYIKININIAIKFNLYNFLADVSINKIFIKITAHFFSGLDFITNSYITKLVNASVIIYNKIRKTLLPTPNKTFYIFNLRDVWKVF